VRGGGGEPVFIEFLQLISVWAIPAMVLGIPAYGLWRGVKVYEVFVEGAEEGLRLAFRITPFLLGILVALGVFRDTGAMHLLLSGFTPLTSWLGVPPEVLPMLLIRPLSGGASLGLATEIMKTHGPDSFVGLLASTIQGSTDTTLYVLTVYFGSVGVTRVRWALPVGLAADVAGFFGAVYFCYRLFG